MSVNVTYIRKQRKQLRRFKCRKVTYCGFGAMFTERNKKAQINKEVKKKN